MPIIRVKDIKTIDERETPKNKTKNKKSNKKKIRGREAIA